MKIKSLFILALAAGSLASCSKMGALSADNFTVVPSPLEAVANEVPVTINGRFPEKYMKKKAEALIAIAHPDYRPILREYMRLAQQKGGHTPHMLTAAFAMHDTYIRKGDMRLVDWSEYIK